MSVTISIRSTEQLRNAADDVSISTGASRNAVVCAAVRHFSLLSLDSQKKLIKEDRLAAVGEKMESLCP